MTLSTILENEKELVGARVVRFSEALTSTGIYTYLKASGLLDKTKDALAGVVTGWVENSTNERFHKSLGIFEKLGFLSDRKLQEHSRKVAFLRGGADFAVRGLVELAPMLADHVHRTNEFNGLVEFYVAWVAYIAREPSLAIQHRVVRLHDQNKRVYDNDRFRRLFEQHAAGRPGLLPRPPASLLDHPEPLYLSILGGVDLRNEPVLGRARELGESLGFKAPDIEQHITVAVDGSDAASNLTSFTGFSLETFARQMIANAARSRDAAVYVIDNDPYHAVRQQRREMVSKGLLMTTALLPLIAGPMGPTLVAAAAPILTRFIDPSNTKNIVELHRQLRNLQEQAQTTSATEA